MKKIRLDAVRNPAAPALKYDLAYPPDLSSSPLPSAYIRGLAYLQSGRGPASSSGVQELLIIRA